MTSEQEHGGVMDGEYARGRAKLPVLEFRYKTRAQVAVDAFRRHHPDVERPRVLELGAADGLTLLHMRELLGATGLYHGVELSDELLALAPELPENVRVFRGDVCQLPPELHAGEYDLVCALAVLEHLSSPLACAREAFRMLRPGGVAVATCPNPFWDEVAGKLGMVDDDAHEVEIDRELMCALFREAGFSSVSYAPFMWAPVGALPYLRVPVPPKFGLRIDRLVARLRVLDFGFVNQAVIAIR